MLGMLINSGVEFNQALEILSEEEGEFPKEIKEVLRQSEDGIPLKGSLTALARKYNSKKIKRAIAQLLTAYEHGSKGNEIKRIGDELLLIQMHEIKEYASRSALFGLLFIVFSVLVPTFFLVISIIGKNAFEFNISKENFILGFLVMIPLINILILLLSKATSPVQSFERKQTLDVLPLVLGAIIIGLLFSNLFQLWMLVPFLVLFGVFGYLEYKKERKVEEIEEELPDAMMALGSMPKGSSLEIMFRKISNGNFGQLSIEFEKSVKQIDAKVRMSKVIQDLYSRVDSLVFKRVIRITNYVLESGSYSVFNEIAEDLLKLFEIQRERKGLMAIQKYTLIAGAFIVPIILSISIKLGGTMGKILEKGSSGMEILEIASNSIPIYLVMYSIIAGYYISDVEGKRSRGILYSFLMLAVSMILYFIV